MLQFADRGLLRAQDLRPERGGGAVRRDSRGGAFACASTPAASAPAIVPISSRCGSARRMSSAGSSAATSPRSWSRTAQVLQWLASSCAARARSSAASCARTTRSSCATARSSRPATFWTCATQHAISMPARFRPIGSSCRVSSTATATLIRSCCAAGPTIGRFEVAQRRALPRRAAARPRRRVLDLRRRVQRDARCRDHDGRGVLLSQRRRQRARRGRDPRRARHRYPARLARTWMDAEYAPPEFRESIDVADGADARADGCAIPRPTSASPRIRSTPHRTT